MPFSLREKILQFRLDVRELEGKALLEQAFGHGLLAGEQDGRHFPQY
jgi:hypothetical protein